MEEKAGKGKKIIALAVLLAFCAFGWYRISETLPPSEAELRAMFSAAEENLPDTYEAEYGQPFDIRDVLPEHFGRLLVTNEADTSKCGSQYTGVSWSAFARNGTEVKSEHVIRVKVTDSSPPQITLKQPYGAVMKGGEYDLTENVAEVSDPVDGLLDHSETLKKGSWTVSGDVSTEKAGIYPVTVRAEDSSGIISEVTFPVTVSAYVKADEEHETDTLARIAVAAERIRLNVGDDFSMDDALLGVFLKDGTSLKQADELSEGTYTVNSTVSTEKAGIFPVAVRAMNSTGDITTSSFTVLVGSDEEIAAATGVDPASAAGQIYLFITGEMGLNKAAACGIMANMRRESGYRPDADNSGMYHGLCQWGGGRLDNLYAFCANNGYYYDSIAGQLHFMQWELNGSYRSVLEQLKYVENSPEGAAYAGSIFAVSYEGAAWVADSAAGAASAMFYEFGY